MANDKCSRYKIVFVIAAVAIALLIIPGAIEIYKYLLAGMSAEQFILILLNEFIGFCFLASGLWVYLKVQTRTTTLFATAALFEAFHIIGSVDIPWRPLSELFICVANVIVTTIPAIWLHFLLVFPKPKAVLEKRNMMFVLYGPAVLLALFNYTTRCINEFVLEARNDFSYILAGLLSQYFETVYLGVIAWAIIHSCVAASSEERSSHGLNFMLLGLIIGITPRIIVFIFSVYAPETRLPGVEYYSLTAVLIPFSVAQAVLKKERSGAPAVVDYGP